MKSHNEGHIEFKLIILAAILVGVGWVLNPRVLWSVAAEGTSLLPGARNAEDLARQGFKPLFDGKSLAGWDVKPWHEGHWVARDGIIDYDGKGKGTRFDDGTLWTRDKYADFVLYVEWRLPAKPELKPQPIVLFNGDFLMQEDNPK